jgi:DNA-binding response OmpR family regulator
MQFRILLADNNNTERDLYERILKEANHVVLTANSPSQTRQIIESQRIHLLIIDRRLTDDSENDRSGEALVQELDLPFPILIFTRWEVREFTNVSEISTKGNVEYLNKNDKLSHILNKINQMLFDTLKINHQLTVPQNIINQVVTQLEQDGDHALNRLTFLAGDLEDLLRHLFEKRTWLELSILKSLSDPALVILDVQANDMEPSLLLVGHQATIERIWQQISHNNLRPELYFPRKWGKWRAYGAIVITPINSSKKPQSLTPLLAWQKSNLHDFTQLWQEFERSTLAAYYEQRPFEELQGEAQLAAIGAAFGLSEQQIKQASLSESAKDLANQAIHHNAHLKLSNGQMSLHDRNEHCHLSWPLSLNLLELARKAEIKFGLVNRGIRADSIQVDPISKTAWLFDLSDIEERRPILQPFVQLELDLKSQEFERQRTGLLERYEFERHLSLAESLRDELNNAELPSRLQTLQQTILQIRQSAARLSRTFKPKEYTICLLFSLYSRLLEHRSSHVQRFAASQLYEAYLQMQIGLLHNALFAPLPQQSSELCYDGSHFSINGEVIHFRRAEMELLTFLAQKPNQIRSTWSIVTSLYEPSLLEEQEARRQNGKNNERDWQQNCLKSYQARLHPIISSIRKKLNDSPKQSRYLITRPGQGLSLMVRII